MSFKNTSNLANGLTKDRVTIQNEFYKIANGNLLLFYLYSQGTT